MVKYHLVRFHMVGSPYQRALSVWKPLVGPNNDWPLALCDYSTIQPADIVQADVLHVDRITENQLLHPNAQHRWYYVENQQDNDLIVFRNVDSMGKRAGLSSDKFGEAAIIDKVQWGSMPPSRIRAQKDHHVRASRSDLSPSDSETQGDIYVVCMC